jgi:hypothetical protein
MLVLGAPRLTDYGGHLVGADYGVLGQEIALVFERRSR